MPVLVQDLRDLVVGGRVRVPILDGTLRPFINLDSAASTPIATPVKAKVDEFLEWYAAVHRGSGFKSQLSTHAYEAARGAVAAFVGADLSDRTLIFVRNTTEAINRCANSLNFEEGDVLLTTLMEHHSNLLAWRKRPVRIEHIEIDADGAPLLEDLAARLAANKGRVKLVTISGGSNVTGVVPDLKRIAHLTHQAGAKLLVDAAQLAPHRPIDMGPVGGEESIDFLAFSGHKMYAPLGTGALIGSYADLEAEVPDLVGGGGVLFVSEESAVFNALPHRAEAGSPNVVGAVAMAAAATFITQQLTWDWLVVHEQALTRHALRRLLAIDGLAIYGPADPALPNDRLGVICFNLPGLDYRLVAAILQHEYAIGTRTGCFCAHPYLIRLFDVPTCQVEAMRDRIVEGDRTVLPGAVRISFSFFNSVEDIDQLADALEAIAAGKWTGQYQQDPATGDYVPVGKPIDYSEWFSLNY